ncbi:hypothetical protein OPIT5_22370 [Opitutaceae bacterium TAV5]|nr:hypothetical protein OPIT5_22370 [Opitutaceae bacterium TAV5]
MVPPGYGKARSRFEKSNFPPIIETRPARTTPRATPAPSMPVKRPTDRFFPIVGIGASAGGLEALVQFFEQVPPDCGMAFAVVQHLDPTQKGMMPELLQRATPMKVLQVTDRTMDNRIGGVVIPFTDITASRKVEAELREQHDRLAGELAGRRSAPDRASPRLPCHPKKKKPRKPAPAARKPGP